MADSDSDQFESADEELSDNDESKSCQAQSSVSLANKAATVATPEHVSKKPNEEHNRIRSNFQNLSLQESNQNAEESLTRKQGLSTDKILSTSSVSTIKSPDKCEETVTDEKFETKSLSNVLAHDLQDKKQGIQTKELKKLDAEKIAPKTSTLKPDENIAKFEPEKPSQVDQQEFRVSPCPEDDTNFEKEEGWDIDPLSDDDLTSPTLQNDLPSKTSPVDSQPIKSEEKSSKGKLQDVSKDTELKGSQVSNKDVPLPSSKNSDKNSEKSPQEKDVSQPEISTNDGWDEDFEIEEDLINQFKSSLQQMTAVLDSGISANQGDDEGWNDGWDTEEVKFSPESSKNDKAKEGLQLSDANSSTSPKEKPIARETGNKNVPAHFDPPVTNRRATLTEERVTTQQQGNQDGWFGWGVTNILSSATEGLSSITSNVTSAFESTIGAPDPTEILQAQKEQDNLNAAEARVGKDSTETQKDQDSASFGGNLFSVTSWTKFVESTSNKVLTTGLDTLETIGKKTMEVLQEGDPGLKKKRAKLREFVSEPGKPVLSQVLREAKERAETSSRKNESARIESKANFEILFDDFEGLVHLEALEMISKQCQIKLDSLALTFSGNEAENFKETLLEIEEFCELPEDDESNSKEAMSESAQFQIKIKEALTQLDVEIQYSKLLEASDEVENRLTKDYTNPSELHQIVISSLAEICAAAMLIFHRAAEMLVIKQKHSTVSETESLMSFGKYICSKLEVTAEKFSLKLRQIDPGDAAKISHISKETSNSITYTKTACQLLVPILQYGAVV